MTTKNEALKLAIEDLETMISIGGDEDCHLDHNGFCKLHYQEDVDNGGCPFIKARKTLQACRTALAEQDSEPVAWSYELATTMVEHGYDGWTERITKHKPFVPEGSIRNLTPLYTTPQPAPAVQQWQPIENAPKDVSILVFHPEGGVCESANIEGKTRRIWVCLDGTRGWSTYFESEPTHWMPLPAPPVAHGIGAPKEDV